jgi:hypothetical protein
MSYLVVTIDLEVDISRSDELSLAVDGDVGQSSLQIVNRFRVYDLSVPNPQVFAYQLMVSKDPTVCEPNYFGRHVCSLSLMNPWVYATFFWS